MKRTLSMKAGQNGVRWVELGGEGRMKMSASTTANFTTALTIMHGAMPAAKIRMPASGGPATAGVLNANEFRPIALPTSSRGTRIETQLCRAGASNDCVAACSALIAKITGSVAVLVNNVAARITARIIVMMLVLSKIGRRE